MKQNRWTRIASFLLVLCLMMALLPGTALAAEGDTGNDTIDFVLLIDCSNTMDSNDPEGLAREACKMFVDLIPVEDARVSIIAFGYQGNEAYTYSNFSVTRGTDAYYVHELTEMEGQLSNDKKDDIKALVDKLADVDGQKTTIGAALAAGVDTLMRNDAADDSACIIMMSDGYFTSTENEVNNNLTNQAVSTAKTHGWPIYCVEMDYEGMNESGSSSKDYDGKEARELLDRIVTESGAGTEGRMRVTDAAEVSEAFMKVFEDVWGIDNANVEPVKLDENGVVTKTFTVPELVSEATIAISSSQVDYVELIGPDVEEKITGNVNKDWLIVNKEDSYICVKLICPDNGEWTVRVHGDPNAEIVWYKGLQQEMNLTMVATASSSEEILTKNDFIEIQAWYTYNDKEILGDDIYETTLENAKLIVTNVNSGAVKQFDMEATMDGYVLKLPVLNAPTGEFTVQVVVESNIFRSGKSASNVSDSFFSDNIPVKLIDGVNTDRSGYVNGTFDTIDLDTVFDNPDGDVITYELNCVSDRNAKFEFTTDESGYMTIATGMAPGTYEMELTAKDPDMAAPVVQTMTLTVEDREIVVIPIPEQEVWVDYYDFLWLRQDPSNLELNIDLSQYFSDPDGVELTYDDVATAGEGGVSAQIENGVIHIVPETKGELVVTFSVNDGVGNPITGQIEVEVVSGRGVYWKSYGIVYAIVIVAILVLLFIIWLILKNKRVKGIWDITVDVDGVQDEIPEVDICNHIAECRGAKFYLVNMIEALSSMMYNVGPSVSKFFAGTGAEKIQLGGVFTRKGCCVLKVPTDSGVSVSINGLPVTKKKKMSSGSLCVTVSLDTGETMTITMKLQ